MCQEKPGEPILALCEVTGAVNKNQDQDDEYVNIPWFAFLSFLGWIYLFRGTHKEISEIRDKSHRKDMRFSLIGESAKAVLLTVILPILLFIVIHIIVIFLSRSINTIMQMSDVSSIVYLLISYMLGVYSCYRLHKWRQKNGFEA